MRISIFFFILLSVALTSGISSEPSCTNLTTLPMDNGYYIVNESKTLCAGEYNARININGSNIVLDCNGSTLYMDNTENGIYIYNDTYSTGFTNITIKNCMLKSFDKGIYARSAEQNGYIFLQNITIESSNYGFYISSSTVSNITVYNSTIDTTKSSIYIKDSTVSDFTLEDNTYLITSTGGMEGNIMLYSGNTITNLAIRGSSLQAAGPSIRVWEGSTVTNLTIERSSLDAGGSGIELFMMSSSPPKIYNIYLIDSTIDSGSNALHEQGTGVIIKNLTISNLTISSGVDGIHLVQTANIEDIIVDRLYMDASNGDGIHIENANNVEKIFLQNTTIDSDNYYGLYIRSSTVSNITVYNSTIDTTKSSIHLYSVTVSDFTLEDTSLACSTCSSENNQPGGNIAVRYENTVTNLTIRRSSLQGKHNIQVWDSTVTNLTIERSSLDAEDMGIYMSKPTGQALGIDNCYLIDSTIDSYYDAFYYDGDSYGYKTIKNLTIFNLTISSIYGDGIDGNHLSKKIDFENIIADQLYMDVSRNGFNIKNVDNLILNNSIIESGWDGIHIENAESIDEIFLHNLTLDFDYNSGISIDANNIHNITVENCSIVSDTTGKYYGVIFGDSESDNIDNIDISDTVIKVKAGVKIAATVDNFTAENIRVNTSYYSYAGGLEFTGVISNASVLNSIFGVSSAWGNSIGIYVNEGNLTYLLIDNVSFQDQYGRGIRFDGNITEVIINNTYLSKEVRLYNENDNEIVNISVINTEADSDIIFDSGKNIHHILFDNFNITSSGNGLQLDATIDTLYIKNCYINGYPMYAFSGRNAVFYGDEIYSLFVVLNSDNVTIENITIRKECPDGLIVINTNNSDISDITIGEEGDKYNNALRLYSLTNTTLHNIDIYRGYLYIGDSACRDDSRNLTLRDVNMTMTTARVYIYTRYPSYNITIENGATGSEYYINTEGDASGIHLRNITSVKTVEMNNAKNVTVEDINPETIQLKRSGNICLRDVTITGASPVGDERGLYITGDTTEHYRHVFENVSMNGKPIYYNVSVSDIIIDGSENSFYNNVASYIFVDSRNITVRNLNSRVSSNYGVFFVNTTGALSNLALENRDTGFLAYFSRDITATNLNLTGNGWESRGLVSFVNVTNITLSHANLTAENEALMIGSETYDGSVSYESYNITINYTRIKADNNYCIWIYGEKAASYNITLSGNTIVKCGEYALYLHNITGFWFYNNYVSEDHGGYYFNFLSDYHFNTTLHEGENIVGENYIGCLLYTSPSPRDLSTSRMPSSA